MNHLDRRTNLRVLAHIANELSKQQPMPKDKIFRSVIEIWTLFSREDFDELYLLCEYAKFEV